MYVTGFVAAIPEQNKEAYRKMAEGWWEVARDYGAVEHVEAWEADVPDGEQTDFRRAVQAKDGEKVLFSWVIWPDKKTADEGDERMMSDPRLAEHEPLFDSRRMIYGGFEPLVTKGRD